MCQPIAQIGDAVKAQRLADLTCKNGREARLPVEHASAHVPAAGDVDGLAGDSSASAGDQGDAIFRTLWHEGTGFTE